MFTGIIEKIGVVRSLEPLGDRSLSLTIQTGFTDLSLGESVAVNGVCLTATETSKDGATRFFVSPETFERTSLGTLAVGDPLNLERALAMGARLSGHWVQGHVDGIARIRKITDL